ncbi:unnamed protein product [Vitrella brassicaformis CCMP3155]|uniref:BSD domain-containing protein n=1 Tax=Vitrella brassicaformis (strain CCMP3155) TaxID=1169540 RepID=A0A0G4G7U2_VITBC|nr:unnamed protein product [Vitrella brassicaformis CCMP3155]|eukprot:CEM24481.1 unnamed protein product [Vitrella brassicaformis CCMP3155]
MKPQKKDTRRAQSRANGDADAKRRLAERSFPCRHQGADGILAITDDQVEWTLSADKKTVISFRHTEVESATKMRIKHSQLFLIVSLKPPSSAAGLECVAFLFASERDWTNAAALMDQYRLSIRPAGRQSRLSVIDASAVHRVSVASTDVSSFDDAVVCSRFGREGVLFTSAEHRTSLWAPIDEDDGMDAEPVCFPTSELGKRGSLVQETGHDGVTRLSLYLSDEEDYAQPGDFDNEANTEEEADEEETRQWEETSSWQIREEMREAQRSSSVPPRQKEAPAASEMTTVLAEWPTIKRRYDELVPRKMSAPAFWHSLLHEGLDHPFRRELEASAGAGGSDAPPAPPDALKYFLLRGRERYQQGADLHSLNPAYVRVKALQQTFVDEMRRTIDIGMSIARRHPREVFPFQTDQLHRYRGDICPACGQLLQMDMSSSIMRDDTSIGNRAFAPPYQLFALHDSEALLRSGDLLPKLRRMAAKVNYPWRY